MMPRLTIRLLGPFEAALDGKSVVGFQSDKTRALLAYLAMESERSHYREKLAGLLWPERTEGSARASLRQALVNLRHLLGERTTGQRLLEVTRQTIRFNEAARPWVDAKTLMQRVRLNGSAQPESKESLSRLEEAASLYRGEFLEGLSLGDADPCEEWARFNRERVHRQVMEVLRLLIRGFEAMGDQARALAHIWRQLELDPWCEEAHRQAMLFLARNGQRGAALSQFESCRRILADELGVEPGAETVQLCNEIRNGALSKVAPSPDQRQSGDRRPCFLLDQAAPRKPNVPPFVGRCKELAQLDMLLDQALDGQGQMAFVTGEVGSGKTCLMAHFARMAQRSRPELVVASASCTAYTGVGDPYHPLREILGLLTGDIEPGCRSGALSTEQASRLWDIAPLTCEALTSEGPQLLDSFIATKALLERSTAFGSKGDKWPERLKKTADESTTGRGGPGSRQSALFEQFTRVLARLAARRPLLLLLDDLQWADPGSISLLFHMARRLGGSRVLVIGAYRAEETFSVANGTKHPLEGIVNELGRDRGEAIIDLGGADGSAFIEALLDSEPNRLGRDFRDILIQQTGGHALFTVELLREMRERKELIRDQDQHWVEGGSLDWTTLPTRVEAIIAERLSRLPAETRAILRGASVQGDTFLADVVALVEKKDRRQVLRLLRDELEGKRQLALFHRQRNAGREGRSEYRFRNRLVQKYLYESLGKAERVQLHAEIGRALEILFEKRPEDIASMSSRLAWHFGEGGQVDKAIRYLRQAGEPSTQVSVRMEAAGNAKQASDLLDRLPDQDRQARQELASHTLHDTVFTTPRGFADREVGAA